MPALSMITKLKRTPGSIWECFGSGPILTSADQAFLNAQELAVAHRLDSEYAAALLNRGLVQLRREHFADAIPLFENARTAANRAGAKNLSNFALDNIANCYEGLGDFSKALKMLETSVAEQTSSGLPTSLSNDYSELGVIHLRMGESAKRDRLFSKGSRFGGQRCSHSVFTSRGQFGNCSRAGRLSGRSRTLQPNRAAVRQPK